MEGLRLPINLNDLEPHGLGLPVDHDDILPFMKDAAAYALNNTEIHLEIERRSMLREYDEATFCQLLDAVKSVKITDLDFESFILTDPVSALRFERLFEALGSISSTRNIKYFYGEGFPAYSAALRNLKHVRNVILICPVGVSGRTELDGNDEYNIQEIAASLRGHPSLRNFDIVAPLLYYPRILPVLRTVP